MYSIYNNGVPQIEPRFANGKIVAQHIIEVYYRPEDFDIYSTTGIGYPLYRDRMDDDDELSLELGTKVDQMTTLAWGALNLFDENLKLNVGNHKVPLYLAPAHQ